MISRPPRNGEGAVVLLHPGTIANVVRIESGWRLSICVT